MFDFENEEEEWDEYGFEDSDNTFVAGITFDEVTIIGAWMEQDTLEPAQQKKLSAGTDFGSTDFRESE